MDFTRTVKALKYCTPSPHGGLIATLESSTLTLYSTEALEPHRVINLEPEFSARISHVQWSRRSEVKAEDAPTIDYQDDSFLDLLDGAKMKTRKPVPLPLRILVADDDTVRVWDAYDKERRWTIENASGVLAKLVHVEFGRTVDELLVFSDFGVKLKIWSLVDGSSVEISDPKFPTGGGHEIRPRTGELTLLTRTDGRDTLSIHNPDTHDLFRATSAATTDAQGLQWSPCGRWITVWDAAFMGYRISFFTADGRLCRVVDSQSKWTREMPGISMLKWSPNSKHLLVGDYFGVFRILNQRLTCTHRFMVRNPGGSAGIKLPPNTKFWREQVDALASSQPLRSYVAMKSTFSVVEARTVPQFAEAKDAPQASFSGDGRHLVAYSAIFPTAVWIFTMEPDLDCIATLVHLREVRQVAWHPSVPGLLLVECEDEDGEHYIYLWSEVWEHPRIIRAPLKKGRGDSKAVSQWATTTTTTMTGGSATATRASLVCGYETQSLIGSVDLEPSGGLHTVLTDASKRMKASSGKENESPGIGYKGGVEDFLSGDW